MKRTDPVVGGAILYRQRVYGNGRPGRLDVVLSQNIFSMHANLLITVSDGKPDDHDGYRGDTASETRARV